MLDNPQELKTTKTGRIHESNYDLTDSHLIAMYTGKVYREKVIEDDEKQYELFTQRYKEFFKAAIQNKMPPEDLKKGKAKALRTFEMNLDQEIRDRYKSEIKKLSDLLISNK